MRPVDNSRFERSVSQSHGVRLGGDSRGKRSGSLSGMRPNGDSGRKKRVVLPVIV